MITNNKGHKVRARGIKVIRQLAQSFRQNFSAPFFPIVQFLEALHANELIEMEIIPKNEMPDKYGLSYPSERRILIREDVYDLARKNNGFARSTIAHELGHIVMHGGEKVAYARSEHKTHKVYEDSEWQANKFAQELLVDVNQLIWSDDEDSISERFGVTKESARVALDSLIRSGDFPPKPH